MLSDYLTGRVPTAPKPQRSPYETGILRAIAAGHRFDTLIAAGPWTINDVTQTLRRHNLAADDNGRIAKVSNAPDPLLQLALNSPNTHVRTKALRAAEMMKDLARLLAAEQDERDAEADRARQRQAVEQWQQWLKDAQEEARRELRHLNPRSKTPKSNAA